MTKICFLTCLWISSLCSLSAQINNSLLSRRMAMNDSSEHEVHVQVYSNLFFKNNESFDPIATGYTLAGSQFQAAIHYQAVKGIDWMGGIYYRYDFGDSARSVVQPILAVQLARNGYSLRMGSLDGNWSHRLSEVLYHYERFMQHPNENGIQFRIQKKKFWSDSWLHWEVMEYLNSPYQEEFSVGHSSSCTLFQTSGGIHCDMLWQGLISHKGGQLDTDTQALKTLCNSSLGIRLLFQPQKKQMINEAGIQFQAMTYNDLSPQKNMVYTSGQGYYTNVWLNSSYGIQCMGAFWKGHRFLSPRGDDRFQSVAGIYGKPGHSETNRQLLIGRILYQKSVMDVVQVDVRLEPCYDMINKTLSYFYSLYFDFNEDILLKKLTRR
ncbi:MAG TPA: hypothetical protein PLP34_00690 [Chitinophagaceae bacterium]|nr:hypothetical protein [Chitinophagaceae bacterium]HNF70897.1 hypothetical protein [Chitinophagaceae bacterium]